MPSRNASRPWWRTRRWQTYLQDLLLERGRRRFHLVVDDHAALGATNFQGRLVEVNPVGLTFPADAQARAEVRSAPSSRLLWEQTITIALVEHEAGHICHSGEKPAAPLLGQLWNALEDEREERRQCRANPDLVPLFDLLGDAAARESKPTADLLAGCLLWRWEHDHAPDQRRFRPNSVDEARWEQAIRPLVERAWEAATSDEVTLLSRQILAILGLSEDAPIPADLPRSICAGAGGQRRKGDAPDGQPVPSQPPLPPDGVPLPGRGAGTAVSPHPSQAEADPTALLAQVEGFARDLALALHPPTPHAWPRPHRSRGELVLERALEGHERPFAFQSAPAPARKLSLLVLVDQSTSMGKRADARSRISSAVTATMLLNRAAELAGIRLGIWGFTAGPTSAMHRPISRGVSETARRRIAGMEGWGVATQLAPVFHQAVEALAACPRDEHRLLVVLHDGELRPYDAAQVRAEVETLAQQRILLQPVFIGDDPRAVDANRAVFGRVLACSQVEELPALLRAWLRATLG